MKPGSLFFKISRKSKFFNKIYIYYNIYRPKLICVEIITDPSLAPGYQFSNLAKLENSEIYKFLIKLNYIKTWSGVFSHLFADNLLKKIL